MKRKAIQFSASAGALIAIALLAPTETHAQTNWTGTISTDWFAAGNWNAGIPTAATDANINTATPNATVVGAAGATALNLAVGATGTALLTIQNGGTVTNLSLVPARSRLQTAGRSSTTPPSGLISAVR